MGIGVPLKDSQIKIAKRDQVLIKQKLSVPQADALVSPETPTQELNVKVENFNMADADDIVASDEDHENIMRQERRDTAIKQLVILHKLTK